MSEFTQGPWVAKGGEVCTEDYEVEGQIMHDHICSCEVVNGESPNANLIAASPELLEALQKLISDYDRYKSATLIEKTELETLPLKAARAAIAKALGQ